MKGYKGEKFLNKIYKDLINSEEIKHYGLGRNKNEDLALYLKALEKITNHATEHNKIRILKYFYYKKYVIKEANIPNSYWKTNELIALSRGYGHIKYDDNLKHEEALKIIKEQQKSLDRWIDYFINEETSYFPVWFKYFVFQGMVRIGYFDKTKNKFTKRTDSTIKPFIEINQEAISMIYSELIKVLENEKIDDKQLENLIKSGSFALIYQHMIHKLYLNRKDLSDSNEGIWKKYIKGSDPNILFNDIHGKGTGWCTAGGISTAKAHLKGGDFYVYYTKDQNNQFTNPRIAIRMENDKISEIRGIEAYQNLEPEMEKVVEQKLEEFPDKDEYKKKVHDMELLTSIYNKNKNGQDLTKEELKFLYEIDEEITGFGYGADPRITEIINTRNIKKDLAFVFDVEEKNISTTKQEALQGNIKYHYKTLDLSDLTSIPDDLELPEIISEHLILANLTDCKNLKLPRDVKGDLVLSSLKTANNLELPENVGKSIYLSNLVSCTNLKFPKKMAGNLDLNKLTKYNNMTLPEVVKKSLKLGSLSSIKGLKLPKEVGLELILSSLTSIEECSLPEIIGRSLDLRSLSTTDNLNLPETMHGNLNLKSLTSIEGVKFPKILEGDLNLSSLITLDTLTIPEMVENLNLSSLIYANYLKFPDTVSGDVNLGKLISAEGIIFPDEIIGDLDLRSLIGTYGLNLPQNILGSLYLNSLVRAEGLKLPKNIGQILNLSSLIEAKRIILPTDSNEKPYVPGTLVSDIKEQEIITCNFERLIYKKAI